MGERWWCPVPLFLPFRASPTILLLFLSRQPHPSSLPGSSKTARRVACGDVDEDGQAWGMPGWEGSEQVTRTAGSSDTSGHVLRLIGVKVNRAARVRTLDGATRPGQEA